MKIEKKKENNVMSFSLKVKEEILSYFPEKKKEIYAQFYGIILFGTKFKNNSFIISYDNKKLFERFIYLIENIKKFEKKEYIKLKKSYNIELIDYKLSNFSIEDLKILKKYISLFLSGVFLSCGSIINPNIGYHLEFNIKNFNLCKILVYAFKLLKKFKFNPKIIKRKNGYSIYIKEHEKIEDFLILVGAKNYAMEFIQIKMIKEVRNNINRNINFETANLYKITTSSTLQIKYIKKIIDCKNIFEKLPEKLKETAHIRINNPYISLKELALLYKKPISKSGVNHRLKKLIDIAKNI